MHTGMYSYNIVYGIYPGSNPGPGENFSLKLLIYDLPDGYSES